MATANETPLIELQGIKKRFGRIEALSDVDFVLQEGEVHGLIGDNGSGKSTLLKTIVGLHEPTQGDIFIRGERTNISSPREAQSYGIEVIYQDLALIDQQSIATNIFLDRYPTKSIGGVLSIIDYSKMKEEADRILQERLHLDLNPSSRVEFLSGGERQAVAIARSLITDPDIILMDEPTSALSAEAAKNVKNLVDSLKQEGISVVIISHDLNELIEMTDRITVLHNGHIAGTVNSETATHSDILYMMVNGEMPQDAEDI